MLSEPFVFFTSRMSLRFRGDNNVRTIIILIRITHTAANIIALCAISSLHLVSIVRGYCGISKPIRRSGWCPKKIKSSVALPAAIIAPYLTGPKSKKNKYLTVLLPCTNRPCLRRFALFKHFVPRIKRTRGVLPIGTVF